MGYPDSLIGRQLGSYRLESLLGRGGMASVYYANDVHLHRPAAVKVLDARYREDPGFAERFVREARVMAAWRHPNIPQIFQAGEEDGISFYAMEYVQGQDLKRLLNRLNRSDKRLTYAEVLRIGRALAEALDYAHSEGVIHRDVKSSNVLVADDGRILLTDFGLVMQVGQGTMGEVFGSPHYMAPEQAGSSAQAVPQSDQYALAVVLFEMLTGALPFEAPSPATVALMQINDAPPTPSKLNPALNREVDVVVLRALRKHPNERFASAGALLDALQQALAPQLTGPETVVMGGRAPVGLEDTLAAVPQAERTPTAPNAVEATLAAPGAAGGSSNGFGARVEPRHAPPAPLSDATRRDGVRKRWLVPLVILVGLCALLAWGASRLVSGARGALGAAQTPGSTAAIATEAPALPGDAAGLPTVAVSPTEPAAAEEPPAEPTPLPPAQVAQTGELTLVRNKGESLIVVNSGDVPFPLARFAAGNNRGEVFGGDWQVEALQPGQCVAVWKQDSKVKLPKGVECELVGEELRVDRDGQFWENPFFALFEEQRVVTCEKKDNACVLQVALGE